MRKNVFYLISCFSMFVIAIIISISFGISEELNCKLLLKQATESDNANLIKDISLKCDINDKLKNYENIGWNALMLAAYKGHLEVVRILIKMGADIEAKDSLGRTALMLAEDVNVCRELINAGANVNARDNNGFSVLMRLIDNSDIVKELLNAGADPNIKSNGTELSAIHLAAAGGDPNIIRMLYSANVDLNTKDKYGRTPLRIAIGNSVEILLELVRLGAKINETDEHGHTALGDAIFGEEDNMGLENTEVPELIEGLKMAKQHYRDVQKILIKAGAELSPEEELMIAIKKKDITSVINSLKKGAKIDKARKGDLYAIHLAVIAGDLEIVRILLNAGAEIEKTTEYWKETPITLATQFNIIQELLKRGADPNAQTLTKFTALIGAVKSRDMQIVKELLYAGANPNVGEDNMRTALMIAAENNDINMVRVLLDAGANPNLTESDRGGTALFYAIKSGEKKMKDVVKMLIQNGADVRIKNNEGKTVLSICKEEENYNEVYKDVCEILQNAEAK